MAAERCTPMPHACTTRLLRDALRSTYPEPPWGAAMSGAVISTGRLTWRTRRARFPGPRAAISLGVISGVPERP